MNVTTAHLKEVLIVEPDIFKDRRGFFLETYHKTRYDAARVRLNGVNRHFVQDNLSFSVKGSLRGLHYQAEHPQAKLIQVISGEIYDVAVDIRLHSPTFGKWFGIHLSAQTMRQLFIPEGFAHGFAVLSETAHVLYKCSDYYVPDDDRGVLWSDPAIGIDWPVDRPILSEKDKNLPLLAHIGPDQLPVF